MLYCVIVCYCITFLNEQGKNTMSPRKKGKRKTEVFSVSVRPEEMEEINKFLDEMSSKTGFRISRNEFMRRAALSHIRFAGEYGQEYEEIFKTIG